MLDGKETDMKQFVYLAGPILGCDKSAANDWRDYVSGELGRLSHQRVVGVSPLRCEPLIGTRYEVQYDDPKYGTPRAILAKNRLDVAKCDLIFAYLPLMSGRPSLGTVKELGWAFASDKPSIIVTDDPLIRDHIVGASAGWLLEDLEAAIDVAVNVLMIYGE